MEPDIQCLCYRSHPRSQCWSENCFLQQPLLHDTLNANDPINVCRFVFPPPHWTIFLNCQKHSQWLHLLLDIQGQKHSQWLHLLVEIQGQKHSQWLHLLVDIQGASDPVSQRMPTSAGSLQVTGIPSIPLPRPASLYRCCEHLLMTSTRASHEFPARDPWPLASGRHSEALTAAL